MRTRELIELRRSNPALRAGSFRPLSLPPPLLGFDREDGRTRARCLFNLSAQALRCGAFLDGECLFSCGEVDHARQVLGPWAGCILAA